MVRALLAALVLAATPAAAQFDPSGLGWTPIVVSKWGGLNLLNDTTMIGGDAQKAQNVLTDSGYLETRPGNTLLTTILSGYPVKYANDWSSPSGTRYLIAQASQTVYQTNFAASPVALSTVASGYNITSVPIFSKLVFADGFRSLWYWDSNSTGTVTDSISGNLAPICTYISAKDSRLWCANLPSGYSVTGNTANGGGSSTVLVSSYGGVGYFSVPSNAAQVDTAANRWDFNPDDGDQITCLSPTPWGMYVGKRYSSYIVKGNGNLSYEPRLLDPKIGCVDNRSAQMVDGVFKWLAVEGVYGYDGSGPPVLLSRKLDPLTAKIRESTFSQGQWATQLQSDWASGTESTTTMSLPPLPWDYTSLSGSIFPSSFTLHDDNTNPGLEVSGRIGFSSDTLVNIDTVSFPLSAGYAQVVPSSSGVQVWLSSFPSGNYTTIATTWTVYQGSFAGDTPSGGMFAHSLGQNSMYTMAATTGGVSLGWTYGFWSFAIAPHFNDRSQTEYGSCGGVNFNCGDFYFIASARPDTAWSGYVLKITENSETSPTSVSLHLNLVKSVAGVTSSLATGDVTTPMSLTTAVISTFSVSRTPGGYFTVYYGTTTVFRAYDASSAGSSSVMSAMTLYQSQPSYPDTVPVSYGAVTLYKLQGYGPGTIVSRIYDTGIASPVAGALSSSFTTPSDGGAGIAFYVRSSTSPNNDLWTSWAASSNNVVASLPRRYWQYRAEFGNSVASDTIKLTSVQYVGISTGYYYSKVNYVGTLITAWRQFGVTETNPGRYGYAVRQATYAFSASNTSIAWTAQTANTNVNLSVSTPTYAQFRLDSTGITNADQAESISGVFLRWDQGANIPVASATRDRRYYLCVTISTAATAPDICLIHQKNGEWVEWTGPSVGALGYYNTQVIAADGGTSSKVWTIMQPNVYTDDGSAIDAQWVSADHTDGFVFNNKVYHEAWVDALPVQGSSVTFAYQVNKSSDFVSTTFSLDNGQPLDYDLPVQNSEHGSLNQWLQPVAGYDTGKYLRVKFSNNNAGQYVRINSYLLYLEPERRQVP